VATAGFSLHFCRKADPESKGKVENVVGYVKKNFLYNRAYEDVEVLNGQAMGWLERTANHLPHNVTKQSPQSQHRIEQEYLRPCRPIPISKKLRPYHVRKDNTISYKSNFYSLPQGTYRGRGSQVLLKEANRSITLYSTDQTFICTHELAAGKGKTILNTHHRRDTSKRVEELIEEAAARFTHPGQARTCLACIKERLPRYIRDHLQCITRALEQVETEVADTTLAFCLKNELYSGSEFEQVLRAGRSKQAAPAQPGSPIKLLHTGSIEKASQTPQTSNLDDYETIIHPNSTTSTL
jgi:hypothetical protein